MTTAQTSSPIAPRRRIGRATVLTALGVLIAIALSITILALTGTNHTTVPTPVTASPTAAGSSTPQTHYLGPRQERAPITPRSRDGTSPAANAGNPAPNYTCLEAARCR